MRLALLLLALCGCEAPPVFATADRAQQGSSGRIDGTVVAAGQARGNAVLFLYEAARPGPPAGTAAPVTFTVVPMARLFGAAGGRGPFTAPFSFSLVKGGDYLITGLIDTGGDFIPWYRVTADANRGDVAGGAVDPVTRAAQVIHVDPLAEQVAVSFSSEGAGPPARMPDRPAFQVAGTSLTATVTMGGGPVVLELLPQAIDEGVVHQVQPVFLFQLADTNLDGVPEVIWPRVAVRKMASCDALLSDDRGDYQHVAGTQIVERDGVPDTVVLAAGFDPTELAMLPPGTSAAPRLKLLVRPVALDATNPALPLPLVAVPSGCYSITLIAATGQTWRVPNELAPAMAGAVGLPAVMSQQFVVQVP